jgi:hypothetical protein
MAMPWVAAAATMPHCSAPTAALPPMAIELAAPALA